MTPIGENLLPDWGHLPYLGPKNLANLECAKNAAKARFFTISIVLPIPKNIKLPKRKKITVVQKVRSFVV